MNTRLPKLALVIGFVVGLAMPATRAWADDAFKKLSAEWWQWVLSIPASENPLLDTIGEKCMVGQRGSVWFLVGNGGGGTTARKCSVPEGNDLFFPVINSVNIDTPNVCGQDANRIPVADLRALSAAFVDGGENLRVDVDGEPVGALHRVQSKVFEVALPEANLFDDPCAAVGGLPAGIYSPAVDDGFYVKLQPLAVGDHTVHIHAENPSGTGFLVDVTYDLTVVPVVTK
jgi:hypothetical protein